MPSVTTASTRQPSQRALAELEAICGKQRTLRRWLDRVAYASDASFYHLVPLAVIQPKDLDEMQALFRWGHQHQVPLTFRAGGTSISGQAVTDGLLIDLSKYWRGIEVREQGQSVWSQPGVIGAHVNQLLRPYQRKIGPDPASIQACMMGGILANNSSGMCCGVTQNAYHTLQSIGFLLPDGQYFNTADPGAYQAFEQNCPQLAQELGALRSEILAQPALSQRIRQKYQQKNTTGYSLNAFLDYEHPLDIFAHLLIGSEGTLALITDSVLQTQPDLPFKHTGLLLFGDIFTACQQIGLLQASGAATIELLDSASLAACPPGSLSSWISELSEGSCALLVEYQYPDQLTAQAQSAELETLLQTLPLLATTRFTQDPAEQAALWKLRKGLYPSVGAVRKSGSTVIIEDVCFPLDKLAEAVQQLQGLFDKHGYQEAIIFGHAKDGNLHFVLAQAFNQASEIARYDAFMRDLTSLVLASDGALKAEHGTGRNMAPFVEAEWGPEAYAIMQRLKRAVDPHQLLNPGVILNPSPQAHLEHLKSLPSVDPEVDRCTECGFCEPACPSRRLSLTPRQRIVLRRERQRLLEQHQQTRLQELEQDYQYSGLDTCAADSLCSLACPIGIDTGSLVKRLRAEASPQGAARSLSAHFGSLEKGLKLALSGAHFASRLLGPKALNLMLQAAEKLSSAELPAWDPDLPPPNYASLPVSQSANAQYVYFPSCLTRSLGYAQRRDLPHTLMLLAQRAGVRVWLPNDAADSVQGLCCGLPFSSKGYAEAGQQTASKSLAQLWKWSNQGQLPVIMDTSPCTYQLKQLQAQNPAYAGLRILDAVAFFDKEVELPLWRRHRHTVVHPVCSLRKLGLENSLLRLAQSCSQEVSVPMGAGCCGFAGDRGLLYPELPQAALSDEKASLAALDADQFCSSSRSCEMGLSLELERPFVSILHLLADALEPESHA